MVHRMLMWVTTVGCLSHKCKILRLQLEIAPLNSWRTDSKSVGVVLIWTVVVQSSGSSILHFIIYSLSIGCGGMTIMIRSYSPLII